MRSGSRILGFSSNLHLTSLPVGLTIQAILPQGTAGHSVLVSYSMSKSSIR